MIATPIRLDIGGGLAPAQGHVNLDPIHGEGEFRRRIQDGIPLPDGSVEAARCSHLMEHIPAGPERIAAFNEVRRVLVPGGTFEVIVPLFTPDSWGWGADPTHLSVWLPESFDYFTGKVQPAADYGIKLWEPVSWSVVPCSWGSEGHCTLRKPR